MSYDPSVVYPSLANRILFLDDCATSSRPAGVTLSNVSFDANNMCLTTTTGVTGTYTTPDLSFAGTVTMEVICVVRDPSNSMVIGLKKGSGGTTQLAYHLIGVNATPARGDGTTVGSMGVVNNGPLLIRYVFGPSGTGNIKAEVRYSDWDVESHNFYIDSTTISNGDPFVFQFTGTKECSFLRIAIMTGVHFAQPY